MKENLKNTEKKPVLTPETRARFILGKTDENVRNAIIAENYGAIRHVVNEFQNIGTLSKDDLFQEGVVAVTEAIVNFNPARDFNVFNCVRWHLMKVISENRTSVSVKADDVMKELKRSRQIQDHRQGRDLTRTEAARELGLPEKSALPSEKSLSSPRHKEKAGSSGSALDITLGDTIKDEKNADPEIGELARAELENLDALVQIITEELEPGKEHLVFSLRYGNDLGNPQKPLKYTGIARAAEISVDVVKPTLERFWRRVRGKIKDKTSGADINENWFYGILRRRNELREFFNSSGNV